MRNLASVFLALAATACSSGFSSGVDGSKPASTLTAEEAETACEAFDAYLQDHFGGAEGLRVDCTIRALADVTLDPQGCQASVNACVVAPPAERMFEIEPLMCAGAMADPTCNATVSETEACIDATVRAYEERLAMVDCAIAGNVPALMRLQDPVAAPPECTALSSTCPNFAGGAFGG